MTFTCTRVATSKTLKWKRVVTKTTMSSQISIKNFAFTVASNVKRTDSLKVTNQDGFTHSVTSDNGAFDVTISAGATASLPTLNPGTYAFHCKFHDSMRGTLVVS